MASLKCFSHRTWMSLGLMKSSKHKRRHTLKVNTSSVSATLFPAVFILVNGTGRTLSVRENSLWQTNNSHLLFLLRTNGAQAKSVRGVWMRVWQTEREAGECVYLKKRRSYRKVKGVSGESKATQALSLLRPISEIGVIGRSRVFLSSAVTLLHSAHRPSPLHPQHSLQFRPFSIA